MSSFRHNATVVPRPGNKHRFLYTHSDRRLKRGKKVREEDDWPLGRINIQAIDGPANVVFI